MNFTQFQEAVEALGPVYKHWLMWELAITSCDKLIEHCADRGMPYVVEAEPNTFAEYAERLAYTREERGKPLKNIAWFFEFHRVGLERAVFVFGDPDDAFIFSMRTPLP